MASQNSVSGAKVRSNISSSGDWLLSIFSRATASGNHPPASTSGNSMRLPECGGQLLGKQQFVFSDKDTHFAPS